MDKKTKIVLFLITITIAVLILTKASEKRYVSVGTSLPVSGHLQEIGESVIYGAKSYFSHINEKGGVQGKTIKFTYLDDKYEPEITQANVKSLLKNEEIFAFFSLVGTPTVKKILPIIDDYKIPLVAPFTGASIIREEGQTDYIVNFRKSYFEEVEALVNYLHKERGIEKFAILYQNDGYGEEVYISTIEVLKTKDLKLVAEGTYKRNTLSISHALYEIETESPQAVIMAGAYKPNSHFIKRAREKGMDTLFCIISFSDADALVRELDNQGDNIIFSQVVPSYSNTELGVVREYQELMEKYFPKSNYGFVSLEAFIGAKLFVEALKITDELKSEQFVDSLLEVKKNSSLAKIFNQIYLFEYKENQFVKVTP